MIILALSSLTIILGVALMATIMGRKPHTEQADINYGGSGDD